jgi:hypothetical protein
MEEEEYVNANRRRRRRLLLVVMFIGSLKKKREERFRDLLSPEGRQRRDRNIPRNALLVPHESPWQKMFRSGDDGACITVTGFDFKTFHSMLELFTPNFDAFTPWTGKQDGLTYKRVTPLKAKGRGRRRMVSAISCLGLVLAWYRFRGGEFILQGWFGFTGTQANVWLRFGRCMLIKCLIKHEDARVAFPSDEKVLQYIKMPQKPLLGGFMIR